VILRVVFKSKWLLCTIYLRENNVAGVGCEIVTAVTMKNYVSWSYNVL
jgi:hypothetical protein